MIRNARFIGFFAVLVLVSCTAATAAVVTFPDAALDAAVRTAINKPTGDILDTDLVGTGFTSLSADYKSIADLSGLEYCTDLTMLSLMGNQISNLQPLAGLTKLMVLTLLSNDITDIAPLAEMRGMNMLSLGNNEIAVLTPLAQMTGLRYLYLGNNHVTDLQPLAGLTSLHTLQVDGNSVTGIEPLAGLANLVQVFFGHNSISDMTPLAELHNLQVIDLDDNQIAALPSLAGLTSLILLSIDNNQISDVGALAGLTGLKTLHLSSNAISSIEALAGLSGLDELELVSNQLTSIGPLVRCQGLATGDVVALSGNALSQDSVCNEVPVLQARGVNITYDGICGIVPEECNIFWVFASEMNNFAALRGTSLSLPSDIQQWDLENWPDAPVGDGIPDLWQLRLVAEAYCDEHHRLHGVLAETFQANMDALLAELPDGSLNFWTVGMMCLSEEALGGICALRGLDPSHYTPCPELLKTADEPFSASGDCDRDGITNLEEYEYVSQNGGSVEDYELAAGENNPFWQNNPALPVGGVAGVILMATGIVLFMLLWNRKVRCG